jgi:hypothetical protein
LAGLWQIVKVGKVKVQAMKGMFYTFFKQNLFHKRKKYIKPPEGGKVC